MTEMEALALHAIQQRRRAHGFGIAKAIERVTGRAVSVGSLYKALHRLERAGYLTADQRDDDAHQGPPRRYYTLTGAGAVALDEFRREHERRGRALNLKKGYAP